MIHIKMGGKEDNFALALILAGRIYRTRRERHGMIKHIRDNRRAWRKLNLGGR